MIFKLPTEIAIQKLLKQEDTDGDKKITVDDCGPKSFIITNTIGEKIAIEIKTFGNASFITAFYEAVGKYIVYRKVLKLMQPDRVLYLAIPVDTYLEYHNETVVKDVFEEESFKIVLYDPDSEKIISWIK